MNAATWKSLRPILLLLLGGGALLALVWRTPGWVGGVVGGIGIILLLLGLQLLKNWAGSIQPPEEPDLPDPFGPPDHFVEEPDLENPAWRRGIRWTAVLMLSAGAGLLIAHKFYPGNLFDPIHTTGYALALLGGVFLAYLSRDDGKSRDIGHLFATDKRALVTVLLLCAGCAFGAAWAGPLAGKPIRQLPMADVALSLGLFFTCFFILLFYLSARLGKPDPNQRHWTPGQKALDRWSMIVVVALLIGIRVAHHFFLRGLVDELKFSLLFFFAGLLPGWLLMDYFKNRFPGFFQVGNEAKWGLEIKIWLSAMMGALIFAGFINWKTALEGPFYEKKVLVLEKTKNRTDARAFYLDWDGRRKKFYPGNPVVDAAEPGDTAVARVHRGVLGFEYVAGFAVLPAAHRMSR